MLHQIQVEHTVHTVQYDSWLCWSHGHFKDALVQLLCMSWWGSKAMFPASTITVNSVSTMHRCHKSNVLYQRLYSQTFHWWVKPWMWQLRCLAWPTISVTESWLIRGANTQKWGKNLARDTTCYCTAQSNHYCKRFYMWYSDLYFFSHGCDENEVIFLCFCISCLHCFTTSLWHSAHGLGWPAWFLST